MKKTLGLLFAFLILLSQITHQPPAQAADPVNLALGKTATASSDGWGNVPGNAVDSDKWGTKWGAVTGDFPQWLTVDLGSSYDLAGANITWVPWDVVNQYKIEVSSDGAAWVVAADRTDGTSKAQEQYAQFRADNVRYVRVTITSVGGGNWAGIYDLKIWQAVKEITNIVPVSVVTEIGKAPVLPDKVTAEYGTETAQVDVSWDPIDESSYAQTGEFTVQGAVPGTELKAIASVRVKGVNGTVITGFQPVTVSTIDGVAPSLPRKVSAVYGDGSVEQLPVVWDSIAPGQYAAEGQFDVLGTVEGTDIRPVAHVTVTKLVLPASFIRGADISTLQAIEDHGGKFYDNGEERDLLDILKDRGVNYIRLRLWNDPQLADGYNDKAHVVELAKRVKAKGFKLLLDFHYSDFWADPGRQDKPEAWANLSYEQLKQAVYDYTKEVVTELKQEQALPDMVQIGNEINSGMLWPDGKSWGQENAFDKLVPLLDSGVRGVKDSLDDGQDVKIMIHLAEGGKNGTFRWFFDEITKRNLDYDVIGLSYYPYWHGTLAELQYNMNDISPRYNKEVVIAETAYPHTLDNGDDHGNIIGLDSQVETGGFPATVEGQAAAVKSVMNAVLQVPNGKGGGVFYWEPAWIPVDGAGWKSGEGNAWDNQAMFDFEGNALPSLDVFKPAPPSAPKEVTATVSSRTSIDLRWTEVDGANGYNIYRASSKNGEFVKLNTAELTGAVYQDTRLNAGRVYYYKVSAINAGGESGQTTEISVTTNPSGQMPPSNK